MRGIVLLVIAVLAAIGLGVGIEATGSSGSSRPPQANWTISSRRPLVHIPAKGPCPTSVRGDNDVANAKDDLSSHLLPQGALFGIICRYTSSPARSPFQLVRSALVNGRTAQAFENTVAKIRTTRPAWVAHCPAAIARVTVLAFGYAHGRVVDLWYEDSGCQTLDNGYLEASELSNPPFQQFIGLVAEIAPIPSVRS